MNHYPDCKFKVLSKCGFISDVKGIGVSSVIDDISLLVIDGNVVYCLAK